MSDEGEYKKLSEPRAMKQIKDLHEQVEQVRLLLGLTSIALDPLAGDGGHLRDDLCEEKPPQMYPIHAELNSLRREVLSLGRIVSRLTATIEQL